MNVLVFHPVQVEQQKSAQRKHLQTQRVIVLTICCHTDANMYQCLDTDSMSSLSLSFRLYE